MSFQKSFAWGAGTSAYQIEGGAYQDGKGVSIWDNFCKTEGKVFNNHTGDTACDHYNRYAEDIQIMNEIGLKAYRFEFSWPRIIPAGTGKVNAKGVDFYDRLIDGLLEAGITPWTTLYHWSMPWEIHLKGGWINPEFPRWFEEYAAVVTERFSDRVSNWLTITEPQVILGAGYLYGDHAPGEKRLLRDVLQMGHNLLLSHGKAVKTIRDNAKSPAKIGFAPVGVVRIPHSNSREDIEAARKDSFHVIPTSIWNSSWWLDPVFLGHYPEQGLKAYKEILPEIGPDDMQTINQKLDFIGANIYTASIVKAGKGGQAECVNHDVNTIHNTYGWAITPEALYWAGKFFYERYKLPMIITENGVCTVDMMARDGRIRDSNRAEFIAQQLSWVKQAMDEGIPFEGYFYWSLMDNFEWHQGYKQRFGLVYVDFITQKRTLKNSAYYYKTIIETNGQAITGGHHASL